MVCGKIDNYAPRVGLRPWFAFLDFHFNLPFRLLFAILASSLNIYIIYIVSKKQFCQLAIKNNLLARIFHSIIYCTHKLLYTGVALPQLIRHTRRGYASGSFSRTSYLCPEGYICRTRRLLCTVLALV